MYQWRLSIGMASSTQPSANTNGCRSHHSQRINVLAAAVALSANANGGLKWRGDYYRRVVMLWRPWRVPL